MLTFIDFFAGVGGFRRGMELAGHKCVGFCEIDKHAAASYTAMHCATEVQRDYIGTLPKKERIIELEKEKYRNGEWYASDITRVRPEDLPEAECFCFGFPCQSFSIAGKRGGFEDCRGTLFFEIMRLVKERKPRYLFAENVTGLLNHDGGDTFETIIRTMAELGYCVEWQVHNSKDYGVPQNRERVYIIGHIGNGGRPKIFPITPPAEEYRFQRSRGNSLEVVGLTRVKRCGGYADKNRIFGAGGFAPTISSSCFKEPYKVAIPVKEATKKGYAIARAYRDSVNFSVAGSKTRRGRVGKDIANTLDTGCNQGIFVELENGNQVYAVWYPKKNCYIAIRKLTPRECFRLQGWTDDYFERAEAVCSDSQLYKQAGNGVTVNVVYEIAKRLE